MPLSLVEFGYPSPIPIDRTGPLGTAARPNEAAEHKADDQCRRGAATVVAKAALALFCALLGAVVLSEVLHWRASKRFLGSGHVPGRSALIVLGFPARRDGRLHPIQKWRTDIARRAFATLGAERIVFSGGPSRGRASEAETMAAYAVQLGVPAKSVRTENKAMSTWQNIELSLPMVEGFSRLAIVSDPLHAARGRRFVKAQRPDLAAHLVSAGEYRLFERSWLKVPTAAYESYVAQHRRLRPGTRYR
ncbi:MAG: YdcF family protein [Acidimicrobiales bacterium]